MSYLTENNHQGIAIIGLNKPETKNAFDRSMVNSLSNALDVLTHDKNVRVIIIRSMLSNVFCAGADLKERVSMTPVEVQRFVTSLRGLFKNIEQLPVPVISALDGAALGGGLEMALACDIRTVSNDAKLGKKKFIEIELSKNSKHYSFSCQTGLVETKLAIIPGAGGTQRLARIVGPAVAKELIFTARIFNGTEATKMGICNHVVDQNDGRDAAYHKAVEIATEILPNGPIGVRMAKKAIDCGLQVDLNSGYSIEEACYAQVIPTADRIEGLKAFAEKRKPKYKGE